MDSGIDDTSSISKPTPDRQPKVRAGCVSNARPDPCRRLVNVGLLTKIRFYGDYLLSFKIDFKNKFKDNIKVADLLTLGAMKAYALGRRAKWKDYVDLYFMLRDQYSWADLIAKADKIFGSGFNEKIFRTQLSYFKDIDQSEEIFYQPGFAVSDKKVKESLIRWSLSR